MRKRTLWILCGCPASGKSYWAKNHINDHTVLISRDEIRFSLLKEGDNYFKHEKEVYKKFVKHIQKALDNGNDVIADATHLDWTSRRKLINSLNLEEVKVKPVWFKTSLKTCLARNREREGLSRVPISVIAGMYERREHPFKDPYNYAAIHNVYEDGTEVIAE